MNITNTAIPEVKIIGPDVFRDNRGLFQETFDPDVFKATLKNPVGFVQEIRMHTKRYELTGLHYQITPYSQGRLIHVENGQVFQVAVDLRKSSPTFSRWVATVLSDENGYRFWIPEEFASGMLTLSDYADIVTLTTKPHDGKSMRCIRWDDPTIAIDWHGIVSPPISSLSPKGISLDKADVFS